MLPSYVSRTFPGTRQRYGVNGNSFVCAVEFGKKVKAKSLLAGGQSGDPRSPHFFDQGRMYTQGDSKTCCFIKKTWKKGQHEPITLANNFFKTPCSDVTTLYFEKNACYNTVGGIVITGTAGKAKCLKIAPLRWQTAYRPKQ
jgi:hypothetical protein